MRKFEYVWLDGYKPEQSLRISKVKVDDFVDIWSFDETIYIYTTRIL